LSKDYNILLPTTNQSELKANNGLYEWQENNLQTMNGCTKNEPLKQQMTLSYCIISNGLGNDRKSNTTLGNLQSGSSPSPMH